MNTDEAIRESVRVDVKRDGVAATARRLKLSRHAVMALAGSAPVRAGTMALAREALAPLAISSTGTVAA